MSSRRSTADWKDLRRRLAESQHLLGTDADELRREEVFRERASELARRAVETADAQPTSELLRLRLGGESYAIELCELSQVVAFKRWVPLPGAAPQVAGVFNLRGRIRVALDLARLLGLEAAPSASRYVLFLQRAPDREGLCVDGVDGTVRAVVPELRSGTTAPSSPCGRFVRGFLPGGPALLDVDSILEHPLLGNGERK